MRTVYLIGVCGTAMATLAVLLKQRGFDVRGSDQQIYPPMNQLLTDNGITFLEGYRSEHISSDLDLVVVGNAISRGNPELEAVLEKRVRYASLPVERPFCRGSGHPRKDDNCVHASVDVAGGRC